MRGKLRDKHDAKRDHAKRELLAGRRPARRDNRNLQLQHFEHDDENAYELAEEGELTVSEEQQN